MRYLLMPILFVVIVSAPAAGQSSGWMPSPDTTAIGHPGDVVPAIPEMPILEFPPQAQIPTWWPETDYYYGMPNLLQPERPRLGRVGGSREEAEAQRVKGERLSRNE